MKIAGVRLGDGRMVWLDAGDTPVSPLDHVTAQLDSDVSEGVVIVAPHQMFTVPGYVDGVLTLATFQSSATPSCDVLPGSELPTLGQSVVWQGMSALVAKLEPVGGRVTIVLDDGMERIISVNELSSV